MKSTVVNLRLLALLALGAGLGLPSRAQHINAGALSTSQGGQLYFQNAQGFVNASGFMITNVAPTLSFSNSGTYAGSFNSGNPTFTALGRTTNNGATPSPFAAAAGSFLELRLETVVSGPAGGTFSFWEEGAAAATLSLGVGQTAPTGNLFDLSNPLFAGTPGADPYGHLHGRRFSVDLEGDYLVGFRIVDTSNNGLNGGPIQSDSQLYFLTFHAIPEPTVMSFAAVGGVVLLVGRWRARREPRI